MSARQIEFQGVQLWIDVDDWESAPSRGEWSFSVRAGGVDITALLCLTQLAVIAGMLSDAWSAEAAYEKGCE